MRALTIRPDDAELFQNVADPEKYTFFISHLSAFKRMWTAEGKVYWLRFLLAFKTNFENTFMGRPEYQFIFDMDEEEQLQSSVFINIHKKFVHDSYSVAKTFVEHIFVVSKHLGSVREPNRIKNPFYAKESREAFRSILGKPEVDEDIPAGPVAFLCSIYSMFMGSICTLLKRWLREPDLSEEAKKNVDYTYFYWKPTTDWEDPDYWPSCFEKYLADTYKDALPKMLLTINIHNTFLNHDECACNDHEGDINIFELLRGPPIEEDEPFCMTQVGYLQPSVLECASHSNCYRKVLHDPGCREPYLCEGSKTCVLICEKTLKKLEITNKPTSIWKKVTAETFTCKMKNKRHVSTFVESHNTRIETFVHHSPESCKSKNLQDEHVGEFMMNMCGDPELRNAFNQHKRKEDFKNRLRSKFHQKYCFDAKDFSDSSFVLTLFENARKIWMMSMLDEKLHIASNSDKNCNNKYAEGSVLNSIESAETTVAVGTNSVLTGRIVLPTPKFCTMSSCGCEKINIEQLVPVPNESKSKPKSKRSRSKKKKKASANNVSNENNDGPSTSTKLPTVNEAKETPVHVPEAKKVESSAPLNPSDSSSEIKQTKKPTSTSAEKQQNSQPKEVPQKVKSLQHKNPSETSGKGSTVIVKEPTPVNKSDCDNSQNECLLLNGEISKDTGDKSSNELCFGDCLTKDAIGHMCSKTICNMKACCHGCVFIEKREFSTQTDNLENGPRVITEKPKKASKSKVNLIREALSLTGKTKKSEEQLQKLSTNLNCNTVQTLTVALESSTTLNDIAVQTAKDGENSNKLTTLESSPKTSSGDAQTLEETSNDKCTVEESVPDNLNDDTSKDGENSKEKTTLESSTNLNGNAVQTSKDGESSKDITTFECNVNKTSSGDAQSLEETSNDKCTVEESVLSISNTPDNSSLDLNDTENRNLIQEHVENDFGLQKTDHIKNIKASDNVSEKVMLEANAAADNLKFDIPEDKIVKEFLTLIGVLKPPSNSEEEIKPASVPQTTNNECDANGKDKKLKFKTCAFCLKKEIAYKTFKRCAQCKAENFAEQRYYCSRQCQVDDWQESHRDEHLKKK